MNEFGNYLYGLRRGAGMTQQELAEKLGVTNRTISKWETGETFPETAQLIPLANIFHVTVDELLRGTGRTENREESAAPLWKRKARRSQPKIRTTPPSFPPLRWRHSSRAASASSCLARRR